MMAGIEALESKNAQLQDLERLQSQVSELEAYKQGEEARLQAEVERLRREFEGSSLGGGGEEAGARRLALEAELAEMKAGMERMQRELEEERARAKVAGAHAVASQSERDGASFDKQQSVDLAERLKQALEQEVMRAKDTQAAMLQRLAAVMAERDDALLAKQQALVMAARMEEQVGLGDALLLVVVLLRLLLLLCFSCAVPVPVPVPVPTLHLMSIQH